MGDRRGEKRREQMRNEERQMLLDELTRTKSGMARAWSGFNAAADPDLVESFIYEINALRARYTYLLRQMKEMEREGGGAPERRPERALPAGWKPLSAYR